MQAKAASQEILYGYMLITMGYGIVTKTKQGTCGSCYGIERKSIMYDNYENEPVGNDNQGENSYYGENYPYGEQSQNQSSTYQYSSQQDTMNNQSPKKKKGKGKKVGIVVGSVVAAGLVVTLGVATVSRIGNEISDRINALTASSDATDTETDVNTEKKDTAVQVPQVTTASEETEVVVTDVTSVVKANMPAMVSISMTSQETVSGWGGQQYTYEGQGSGSGILVGQNDSELLIVTNNHVVDGATTLTVTFVDGESVSAQIKGTDSSMDLAVVAVNISDVKSTTLEQIAYATLGDSESLQLGEPVVAIGNALGYGQSVTSGIISAVNVNLGDDEMSSSFIQTDAAINAGNSGGALLNSKGQLIGINSAKISSSGSGTSVDNMGYAIPISQAKPIIDELMNKETRTKVEEADRGYLGIRGNSVTQEFNQGYGMPYGVYVAEVIEGKAAEQAGVQMGDIIVKVDGDSIESMTDLSGKLEYYKKGETITITVARISNGEYKEQELTLTLGDLPEEEESTTTQQDDSGSDSDEYYNFFPFQMNP